MAALTCVGQSSRAGATLGFPCSVVRVEGGDRLPDCVLPTDEERANELKKRTLTNFYQQHRAWLDHARRASNERSRPFGAEPCIIRRRDPQAPVRAEPGPRRSILGRRGLMSTAPLLGVIARQRPPRVPPRSIDYIPRQGYATRGPASGAGSSQSSHGRRTRKPNEPHGLATGNSMVERAGRSLTIATFLGGRPVGDKPAPSGPDAHVGPAGKAAAGARSISACDRTNPRDRPGSMFEDASPSIWRPSLSLRRAFHDRRREGRPRAEQARLPGPSGKMEVGVMSNEPEDRARPTAQRCDRIDSRPSPARRRALYGCRPEGCAVAVKRGNASRSSSASLACPSRRRGWAAGGSSAPQPNEAERSAEINCLAIRSRRFCGRRCLSGPPCMTAGAKAAPCGTGSAARPVGQGGHVIRRCLRPNEPERSPRSIASGCDRVDFELSLSFRPPLYGCRR
jgi:hypothetical protein